MHQETFPKERLPVAKGKLKVKVPCEKSVDPPVITPKGAMTDVTEGFSPGTLSWEETLNGSLEVILNSDDEIFLGFVEQFTSTLNQVDKTRKSDENQRHHFQTQAVSPLSDIDQPSSRCSNFETQVAKVPSIASTAERLDQIHTKVVNLQFENDAIKAVNSRLFEYVKTLRGQILSSSAAGASSSTIIPSSPSSEAVEQAQLLKELSEKLSKQESQLEKQRTKYEKLKIKLTEKKNTYKSLLKGKILNEDTDSVPRSITANPDAVLVERLHFEKELDVLELEVRCLQKELAAALNEVDRLHEEEKLDKEMIASLRKELDEKNALIESLTQNNSVAQNSVNVSSTTQENNLPDQALESQASAAKNMSQELAAVVQFKQEENEGELPTMSKYLQIRNLQKELSSAQRLIRNQQRELKALAGTHGISEFMKIWRSEKENLEKRIFELEQELQRSIRSRHDASFYSAEESTISSDSSCSLNSQTSERSPRPISPSFFLNTQVGWPPINLELLERLEIRHGDQ